MHDNQIHPAFVKGTLAQCNLKRHIRTWHQEVFKAIEHAKAHGQSIDLVISHWLNKSVKHELAQKKVSTYFIKALLGNKCKYKFSFYPKHNILISYKHI